ncbi:MAG TPA: hypothetical protein EYP22_10175 [Methanosarcinales archaeon]|nr:hypothetical protein [Methanosarcinales archaeon]
MSLKEFNLILSILRKKLIYLGVIFGSGFLLAMIPIINIYDGRISLAKWVLYFIKSNLYKDIRLIVLTPTEVFLLELKIALIFGALLVIPLVVYYIYKVNKRMLGITLPFKKFYVLVIGFSAIILFLLGASYSYFMLKEFIIPFLHIYNVSAGVEESYSISTAIYFIVMLMAGFGVAFELPLILIFLVRSGILDYSTLTKSRRTVYVALLTVAAIITPQDVFSQIVAFVPLFVLFESSLFIIKISNWISKKRVILVGSEQ